MSAFDLDLSKASSVSAVITKDHFGANFVYNYEAFGDEPWEKYDEVIAEIGITNLRYPGGNGVETNFDFTNPNATTNEAGQTVTPMDEFIQFVGANNLDATIIMPTRNFLPGESHDFLTYSASELKWVVDQSKLANVKGDIETFVRTIMQEAHDAGANIHAIQIGNEYPGVDWTTPSGEASKMNAKQYGQLANELAKITQATIDAFNAGVGTGQQDPQIVAQIWGDWNQDGLSSDQLATANAAVLEQFDAEGLAALDTVSSHLYFKELKSNSVGEAHSYETLSQKVIDMVSMSEIWDIAADKDLDIMVSEWNVMKWSYHDPGFDYWEENDSWNVSQDWIDHSYFGLKQVAPMLEMFSSFLKAGVDSAHVWSVMYSASALSTHFNGGQLYAAGGLMKIMQTDLIGASYVEMDFQTEELDIHVFENDNTGHVFVSSLKEEEQVVSLDLGDFTSDPGSISIKYLRADQANSDGQYTINEMTYILPGTQYAYLEMDLSLLIETGAVVLDGTKILITLDSFESAYVTFDTDGRITAPTGEVRSENSFGESAVLVAAEFDSADPFSIFDDSDNSLGTVQFNSRGWAVREGDDASGDNSSGSAGDNGDALFVGNKLQEKLFGSAGADELTGSDGRDIIWGHGNKDTLVGKAGNDLLIGGHGDDTLSGGAGDDRLFGSSGADRIDGGTGDDALKGGGGQDTFIFSGAFGDDIISDFDADEDQLALQSPEAFNVEDKEQMIREFATQVGDDVIIDFQTGPSITLRDFTLSDLEDSDVLFF